MQTEVEELEEPILTCVEGTNADLFPVALRMYTPPGSRIADITYGNGVFWRNIDKSAYQLIESDLQTGVDFRCLPYRDAEFDAVVFDPPYMNGGSGVKHSMNKCYKNNDNNMCHENVLALYMQGILEARRVLCRSGVLYVKCQAAVADHKQNMTHVQLMTLMPMIGLRIEDEFVLKQSSRPLMRHKTQQHARKNHSYLIVARRTR